jgi:hypothetical protein
MRKAFARGIAITGGRFFSGVIVVSGGFRGIPILMHSGL